MKLDISNLTEILKAIEARKEYLQIKRAVIRKNNLLFYKKWLKKRAVFHLASADYTDFLNAADQNEEVAFHFNGTCVCLVLAESLRGRILEIVHARNISYTEVIDRLSKSDSKENIVRELDLMIKEGSILLILPHL